ncbi:MAG: hypothetical protein ACRD43_09640, partial [Pyrinomonadaceae bacterium]
MCQKIVISAFILLAFCFTEATAQEPVSVVSLPAPVFKTKYERFVSPPDKIFITESYPIAGFKNGYRVSVLVSYAFGEKHRVYGASFGERIIDFQQLEPLRKRLDEIIQTIKSFDQSDLASVNYH